MSLETAAELTRAPDASSALLWGVCSIFQIVMVLGAFTFPTVEVEEVRMTSAFRQPSLP